MYRFEIYLPCFKHKFDTRTNLETINWMNLLLTITLNSNHIQVCIIYMDKNPLRIINNSLLASGSMVLIYFICLIPNVDAVNSCSTVQKLIYEDPDMGIRIEYPANWKPFDHQLLMQI